jgi:hypothetical protein
MAKRSSGKRTTAAAVRVPRNGYAFVTVTARDANGFVHHYGDVETPIGAMQEALAILRIHSVEMESAHHDTRTA